MADRPLRTKQIAHELHRSERTVRRLFKEGKLCGAYKLAGGRTSPIEMDRADIAKMKRGQRK